MASVALAFDDVGLAVPVQEALEAAGHLVTWSVGLTPALVAAGGAHFDAVVLGADGDLATRAEAWRDLDRPPALVAVGGREAQPAADAAGVTFLVASSPPAAFAGALARALGLRWLGRLSPAFARGALGLPAGADALRDAAAILARSRRMDLDLAREALRRHADDYVTAQPLVGELRELRALEIPEVALTERLDGAHTVRHVVASGAMEPTAAARALWALCSIGAARLSPEPPDPASPDRRAVVEARRHLRARRARVARTTIYDLLEVSRGAPAAEIDHALRMLAIRFSPERLARLDLGDVAVHIGPMWEQLARARAVLADPARLARYDDKISGDPPAGATWWQGPFDTARAEQHFARGQKALIDGEAFKAVSEFAAAARLHPEHPDYEASLAWARFRADVARGLDRVECARRERAAVEEITRGRRPWPRALVALALLSAADDDAEAARWHLREALACDPSLPAAQQLLGRLGQR